MKKIKSVGLERKRPACNERDNAKKSCDKFQLEFNRGVYSRRSDAHCKRGRSRSGPLRVGGLSILLCVVASTFACTPRAFEKKPSVATPAAIENQMTGVPAEIEKMRTADLKFIFVFRRPDGEAVDGEDKKFLKANLPFNNRVVVADEEKAVVVGSNYPFPPENLDALRTRFNVEDFSATQGK